MRSLGFGEDPLTWAIPVGSILGLKLRVHVLVPLWIVAEMVVSLPKGNLGPGHVARVVGAVTILAALRELARVLVARRLGAEHGSIVLWPLGGLSASNWAGPRPGLLSEAGGIALGLLITAALGGAVVAAGGAAETLVFNPFAPSQIVNGVRSQTVLTLWWAYYASVLLTGANLLLPMLPLDAGRVLQAWVHGRSGTQAAHRVVARVGFLVALTVFVVGAAGNEARLMALAAFGALATWMDLRRGAFVAMPQARHDREADENTEAEVPIVEEHAMETTKPAVPDSDQLDRILAKISRDGLASLTPAEREILERETERRRRG